jgi:hypothetical protein
MIEPQDIWRLLSGLHVHLHQEQDQGFLLLRVCFWTNREIGVKFAMSESAVLKRLQRLEDLVCVRLGEQRQPIPIGAWAALHRPCCLGRGEAFLEIRP